MTAKPVPCWTIVCDICGADGSESTEYVGMTDVEMVRDHLWDCDWICMGRIDICDGHLTGWAHDLPLGHCWGCDEDDALTWLGNCAECWEKAMHP